MQATACLSCKTDFLCTLHYCGSIGDNDVAWDEFGAFLRGYGLMKVKNDHCSKFSNLSNWKEEASKKNQGFNGIRTRDLRIAGALLYQLSYEATHWERGQFIEFISPVRSEMTWSIYECKYIYRRLIVRMFLYAFKYSHLLTTRDVSQERYLLLSGRNYILMT